jgi:pyrroline-5-carboxylate reductase
MSQTIAPPFAGWRAELSGAARVQRVAVIGCGTMGRAIVGGAVGSGAFAADRLVLTSHSPESASALAEEIGGGARSFRDNSAACAESDVVILCVKPKDVTVVLNELAASGALAHGPLVISIAAGIRIAEMEALLGGATPVIRAMPNTPCRIGKGMTVLSKGKLATDEQLAFATEVFSSVGRCIALEEKHLDAVTAVSASGPAFVYVVIEAISDGGVMCGLPRHVAFELVAQMTLGAAAMVLESDEHPAMLKDDVTTPAGCTIAGLLALEDGRVRSVFARAVETTARVAAGLGR